MNQYGFSKSFYDWCIENDRQDLLDRWDYDLNEKSPKEVAFTSNKKYWIKCPRGIHDSELHAISPITNKALKLKDINCNKCKSIGQFLIDTYGKETFDKIWSDKNIYDPFELYAHSLKKIWLKCLNDNTHPDYEVSCDNATRTVGCPYCIGRKVCLTNSLGYNYPKILDKWSDKNKKTQYDYTSGSSQKAWFKCENGIHDDYERKICDEISHKMCCHKCCSKNQKHKGGNKLKEPDDSSGKKFGRLTPKYYIRKGNNKAVCWVCECDCGKITEVSDFRLKHGIIKSCGCLWLENISGENNHNWKGGITPELEKERHSKKYKEWQLNVYRKDFYTCQCCGNNKNLRAHHVLNFSNNPNLRYELSNGITLCKECHDIQGCSGSFHNVYGTLNNTPEQLEEYINEKREAVGITEPFSIEEYKNGKILKSKD